MAPHHEQLALFATTLNDERRVTPLLLTILTIFVVPWLTLVFCIIAPFFLNKSNEMAIGSLAPGPGGYVLGLGIGLKVSRGT
ncbi:hypothetical protein [Absidia glauca]|uniref:Uncharacterized protein n=1 Tax=Absidia glauca TaxID=4829 RepID=A0A168Q488_ABSGL|nr:hypothetical protein [Absidia glauca]